MRLTAILFMMIVLTPILCSAQQDSRLEGCVDPEIIATVLSEMMQHKSQQISEAQFRAKWPTELIDYEVDPPASRRSLKSEDRILKGHWQCGEVFTFAQERGKSELELRNVTVNYSARRRDTLVAMAKLFAKSVGLGMSDLRTVGAEESQGYQWENIQAEERRAYLIDLRFTREAGLWKMYFYSASFVVEA